MPKKLPDCPQPPSSGHSASETFTQTYLISVVTPLFGGGVEAGTNDPITAVRGTSIRGHLRFWWRATRGASLSLEALKGQEALIWGSSEQPSAVSVHIEIVHPGMAKACAEYPPGKNFPKFANSYPPYALFPFQGKASQGRVESQPAQAREGVRFHLKVSAPKPYQKDVEAALWAWINFGGLGARTRRGCGSLYCKEFSPAPEQVKQLPQWYMQALQKYAIQPSENAYTLWTSLPKTGNLIFSQRPDTPLKTWYLIVSKLQKFRQSENFARNPGQEPNRPGRSRWPEPESIRKITRQRLLKHQAQDAIPTPFFPRAALGLPIVFHFKDKADPADTILEPVGDASRMASPVILKALAVSEKDAIPMALFMKRPQLLGIKLLSGKNILYKDKVAQQSITDKSLASYENSPMRNDPEGGRAMVSFLKFIQNELKG